MSNDKDPEQQRPGSEIALWISVTALGLQALDRVEDLFRASSWLRGVLDGWEQLMAGASSAIVFLLARVTGFAVSPAFVPLVALVFQLGAVVIFAFLYFGVQPYWIQAARAKPHVPLLPRFFINFVACLVLLYLVLQSSGLTFGGAGNLPGLVTTVDGKSEIVAPLTVLDNVLVSATFVLTMILVGWHPGAAWRVLFVAVGLWCLSLLTLLPEIALHFWQNVLEPLLTS